MSKSSYVTHEDIVVTVSGITEQMENDSCWVSIYRAGRPHDAFSEYHLPTKGTSTFIFNGDLVSGDWEISISMSGAGTTTVSGGAVSATTGTAIYSVSTVTLSGGTVSATTGTAIEAEEIEKTGAGTATVSSGGTAISSSVADSFVKATAGTLDITGAVSLTGATSGVYATNGGTVNITGAVSTTESVWANNNGVIAITGNVSAYDVGTGNTGGMVTITGNVTVTSSIDAYDGGKTYITGTVTNGTVILVDNATLESGKAGDFTANTTLASPYNGYYWDKYTDTTATPQSYVYLRKGAIPGASSSSGGGGGGSSSGPSHSFDGKNSTYTQGSDKPLVHITGKDFKLFSGVKVDGGALTKDKQYKAESGSTKIMLFADYLETLSAGQHTLTVSFTDGTSVTDKFTVKDSAAEPESLFKDVSENAWYTVGFCLY